MKEKSLRWRRALRLVLLFLLFTTIGMTKLQAHDFEVDNLLYTIIGTNPPTVSLDGHVDGTSASDELLIPETVEYDDVTYTVVAIGANAFADCTDMYGDIDIPNTVLTIGDHAFDGAGFDGNLILGEAVTTIGNYAFANLGSTGGDLIIPDAVIHIGTCAFYQSYFDGSFAMSDAIVSIGDSAFYNCPHVSISNLKLSNTLTEIGDYAFYYCTNMTGRLTLSTALTSVGAHAFQNCGFTQLNFGSTTGSQLQSIGDYAFAYCVNMTGNLAFPNSLQTVGQYAFYYCGFNNTLTLRNVQSIGECAFQSCSFSKNLTIPNTVTEIGPGAFYNAFTAGTLTINANINTIPNYAFASCHFTGTLTIPNSVVSIGSYAFSSCSGFTGELNIHENVISIGCGAFNWCSGFTRLNYNATNCSIISNGWDGYGWVENCTNLTDLYIAENVQTISDHAFEVAFSSINVLAQTPPTLGESVFSNVNTTSVYVPCGFEEAYTSINWGGFSNIYGLCSGTVTVLANPTEGGSVTGGGYYEMGTNCTVTAIANPGYVFVNWTRNDIIVSSSAEYTFPIAGDMTLVATFVPDGNIAFADANVKSICVEYWDTNSDGELSYLEAASVKTIGTRFEYNEDITSFEELQYFIGLTSISDFAFWSCYRLSTVVLPSTIRTIGNRAFLNSGLSVITVLSSTPPTLGENVFGYEPNSLVSVYVPCGSEQAYSTISWGDLSDFYGMCAGNVTVMANPTAGGSVTGGGNYEGGTTCTVTATANTGYVFANWMKNGKIASRNSEYTFFVAGDMELVANFVPDGNIAFADANVKSICISNWDTNGDGELSYAEAASVSSLVNEYYVNAFQDNNEIVSFDELQYFIGLASIGNSAFEYCHNLSSVILPNTVTTLGAAAFAYCENLVSIELPASLTVIGGSVFYGCSSLTGSITIGEHVTMIGDNAFAYCSNITSLNFNAINSVITNEYGQHGWLYGCTGLHTLTIGDQVQTIPDYAFYRSDVNLTGELVIPASVTAIGEQAFANNSFTAIYSLPMTPSALGNNAFENISQSIPVYVPCNAVEAYEDISWGGFNTISGLCGGTVTAKVNPADAGTVTGGGVFEPNQTCTLVATANPGYIFANWAKNGVVVSRSAEYTFPVASDVTMVANFFPDANIVFVDANVKNICVEHWDTNGDGELSYLEAAAVTSLSDEFQYNSDIISFEELQYFVGLTSIKDQAFRNCSNLTSVVFPYSLTSIEERAFYGCSNLVSVVFPYSLTSIGYRAFRLCGLASIILPASLKSIGEEAFYSTIAEVYCMATTPPSLGDNAFYGVGQDIPVYVPCDAVEAYENVSWGGFNTFNGLCGGAVTVIAKPTEGGVVTGGGTIEADQYCVVTATANPGYMFVNWTKNDVIVSSNSEYTFLVANDMTLVANFMLEGNITFADANVKNICVEQWDTNGDGELSYMEAATVTSLEDYWGNSYFNNNTEITSFNELQYFIGLGEIYDNTFYRCTNLASISLPPYISYIGSRAFYECSSLTGNLVIPNTVQWIGLEAFSGCINLSGNLVLPVSLTTLEQDAFSDCSGFTGDLVIPNSLTTIAYGAFYGCSGLNGNLTIGESITSIGGMAFYNCSNIQSITVLPEEMPGLGSETFSGVSMDIPVYVPCDALADYQNSSWGGFTNFEGVCNCYRPTNLASAQIGATNALISWDGTSDSYVLQYRTAAQDMNMNVWHQIGDDIITTGALTSYTFDLSAYSGTGSIAIRHYNCSGMFKIAIDSIVVTNALDEEILNEGFEEGIPATWTNLDYDGDGYTWGLANFSGWTLGTYCLYSESYNGDAGDLTPDNWMIIPDVELGGTLTLYAKATDVNWADENFGVFVTTESYAAVPAGAWSSEISTTALSYQLTGLTANTPYEWRVKGICDSEESKWASSSFVTIAEGFKTFTTSGNWDVATNWFPEGVPTLADEISIEAAATIPTGVVAVAKRASVNGGGTLTIEDGGQLKQGAATLKVTVKKNVIGYGEANATDQDGYSIIAPPFGGTTQFYYDANWNHVLNLTSGTYDLYAFDASCVGQEWQNQESGAFTSMASGSGYLYANQDNKTLMFTGGAIGSTNNTITKPFEYDPTSTDPFNGFKLVGNPFTCEAYLSFAPAGADPQNVDFYVMNAKGDGFELGQTGVALNVCQGALFYSDASGDIVYSSEVPSSKGSGALNINLVENGQTADVARVRFGEGRRLAKAVFNDNSSKIYILQNNKDYAVVYSEDQGEMPVNFKAKNNGAYTLNFSNDEVTFSYLHLIDNKTGADIDLLETPSYTFDARTTDYVSRFKLVYAKGGSNTSDNFAFINNGNLMVLGIEGKATLQVIDVTGRTISNETFSGNYSKAINAKVGVYMLRLIQGNDVRTQKIVVR